MRSSSVTLNTTLWEGVLPSRGITLPLRKHWERGGGAAVLVLPEPVSINLSEKLCVGWYPPYHTVKTALQFTVKIRLTPSRDRSLKLGFLMLWWLLCPWSCTVRAAFLLKKVSGVEWLFKFLTLFKYPTQTKQQKLLWVLFTTTLPSGV